MINQHFRPRDTPPTVPPNHLPPPTCSCRALSETLGSSAGGNPPSPSATPHPRKPFAQISTAASRLTPAAAARTVEPGLLGLLPPPPPFLPASVDADGFLEEMEAVVVEDEKGAVLSATQEGQNQSPSGTEDSSRHWMWHFASHLLHDTREKRYKQYQQQKSLYTG